jgi:hypothetical protein
LSLIPFGFWAASGAGGGAGAFDLLETTTISSNTDTISITGLNTYSDYKHLQIRMVVKNGSSGTSFDNVFMQLNGDTGSNYSNHYLRGYSGSVSSGSFSPSPYLWIPNSFPKQGETNIYGSVVLDILDFSSSSKNTTVRHLNGAVTSTPVVTFGSGAWLNTSAVTSILFLSGERNYAPGSRISIYGVKGTV